LWGEKKTKKLGAPKTSSELRNKSRNSGRVGRGPWGGAQEKILNTGSI